MSYFLFFKVCENFEIYHYIKGEFTPLWQVFQFFFFFSLQCLSRYMCGHNLTMKFPHDFHNCTGLNRLVNYCSYFTVAPPKKLILTWSLSDLQKEKNNIMWEVIARRFLQKRFPKKLTKFTEKLCYSLFLILLRTFRLSGLQLY